MLPNFLNAALKVNWSERDEAEGDYVLRPACVSSGRVQSSHRALRRPWKPAGERASLRAKGALKGSFKGRAYREEPGVGKQGSGQESWM